MTREEGRLIEVKFPRYDPAAVEALMAVYGLFRFTQHEAPNLLGAVKPEHRMAATLAFNTAHQAVTPSDRREFWDRVNLESNNQSAISDKEE